MKKIENVVVLDPIYPVKNKRKLEKSNFYCERIPTITNDLILDDNASIEIKKSKIKSTLEKIQKTIDDNAHQYAFLKLFSRAAKVDVDFNRKLSELEHFSSELRNRLKMINRMHNSYRQNDELFNLNYNDFSTKIFEIKSYANGLKKDISRLEKQYYPQLKVTAYNLIDGKSTKEVELFTVDVEKFIADFKNFEESFDYICYYSGELIMDTVSSLVTILQKNNFKIDNKYFLNSEVVITYTYFEWIDLIRKIKLVLRKYKDLAYNTEFSKNFHELEVRYGVIVIYNARMGE